MRKNESKYFAQITKNDELVKMMKRTVFCCIFEGIVILFCCFFPSVVTGAEENENVRERPNIVIVLTDDQGYADLGCFGACKFRTPNLDRLAEEGRMFTNFYAGSTVCSPSRASLLTGCYPDRVGIPGFVFFPTTGENPGPGPTGLHPDEITIAEMLKAQGYATACVGKWHLGDALPFLPTRQGFNEYFGLPYSNDMRNGPNPPSPGERTGFPPLPLYDGETIIETDPDQRFLTRRYTERAVDFIERNRNRPFFLYLPHTMPHVPLYVHPEFEGTSEQGLYGDVIQEIDWSVGRILQTLNDCGIDDKTWVIFTSDNGPWLTMGDHGGSALPLRDGKQTKYDGGHRVPCVMRFPGKIKANTVGNEMACFIDFFPTIASLCGGAVPDDRVIDGVEAWDFFSGQLETSPRNTYFYNTSVIRHGKWKLFLPGTYIELNRETITNQNVTYETPRLYDLDADVGETTDLHEQYPEIVESLTLQLEEYRADLEKHSRPLGNVGKRN